MGGIRPSGLHINKPAIIGLVLLFVGCFVVYKYMWSEYSFMSFSKNEKAVSVNKDTNPRVEDNHKPVASIQPPVIDTGPPKVVVLNISSLIDPPPLSDAVKASFEKKQAVVELTISGQKYSTYVETVVKKDKPPSLTVLFLHGAKFTSQNWVEIKVLEHVASWGFKAVAVDLPGYGKSKATFDQTLVGSYLPALIAALQIDKPVIVSPSMSGTFSLPFLFDDPEKSTSKALAFVPVAPVNVKKYEAAYSKSQLVTLIVYGTKDLSLGVPGLPSLQRLPNSLTAPVEGAGHACYLDDSKTFIKYLYSFLRELKG